MSAPTWEYIAKIVCIGDSGTGKSSLTIRLCEGRFSPSHYLTIGVEFASRIVPCGPPLFPRKTNTSESSPSKPSDSGKPSIDATDAPVAAESSGLPEPRRKETTVEQKHMKLSLWDTAGQETYKSVTRSYFRGASGALLVFDITRRPTFLHVTDWLNDLRQIAEPDIVVILVGNKADLDSDETESKREVSQAEARDWAQQNNVLEYVETSAKSGDGVEEAFGRVAQKIYENIEDGKYDLNDRRSGVKGAGAIGRGRGSGNGTVRLRSTDARSGWMGGCC